MSRPLLTVVIPTRERAHTIGSCLQTVLGEPSPRLQVVVSDNAGQDNTAEVVSRFREPRLRYVRTDRRLSMCDNWEFALSHAEGEYVLFIGDDDGLMPGAVARIEKLAETQPYPIYCWDSHSYRWPTKAAPAAVDVLVPPTAPHEMDLHGMVRQCFALGGLRYRRLPMVYHSCVARGALDTLRERTGRVFHSTQPDVFLAFALPPLCDKCLHVGEALTAYGNSEPYLGEGSIEKKETIFARKVQRFLEEYGDYRMHPSLYPDVPAFVNMIPDAMLIARDLFPDYYRDIPFNHEASLAWMERYWQFASPAQILAKAGAIRAHHRFSAARFLAYVLLHRAVEARRSVRGRLSRQGRPRAETTACANILDFVQSVGRDACAQ